MDDRIPDELKKIWVDNFQMIQELRGVTFNRAIVPKNTGNLSIDSLDRVVLSNTEKQEFVNECPNPVSPIFIHHGHHSPWSPGRVVTN